MGPRQLSQQRCDFSRSFLEGRIKLPHAEEARPREALKVSMVVSQIIGELFNYGFAPFGGVNLVLDVFTNAPIETDQFDVHRLQSATASGLDHANHFRE